MNSGSMPPPPPQAPQEKRPGDPSPPPIPGPDAPPLPQGYGRDTVVALVRDPNHLFAHWDLTGGGHETIAQARGEEFAQACKTTLRVERCADGSRRIVDLPPEAETWHLEVLPDTTYRVEVGLLAPDGEFLALAVSRTVTTPRDRASDRVDEEWGVSEEDFEALVRLAGGTGGSSGWISSGTRMR